MSGLIDIRQLWANGLATLVRGERHWHFLASPLGSSAWDGDAYSTTAKTLIDLSAVFGVPSGVKAVYAAFALRDSASSSTDCYFILSPNNAAGVGMSVTAHAVNDRFTRGSMIVPCDSNGDIYYQIAASGSGTMDIYLEIWGWLY